MKSFGSTLAALGGLGLLMGLGLAACGGYSSIDVGGTVSGLTTEGLVLANGGNTVSIPANATSYKFPSQIGNYDSYNVVVQTQPPRLTCGVGNNAGTATGTSITWANVACVPNTFTLGGTVTGLTTEGLKLTNGNDTLSVAANTTSFTFGRQVADGAVYGVAILAQPAGQTCSVANGTATMGSANVTSIRVSCS
jgi:hypothetical protein